MLLNDVFERFAQDSPVPVMVRALLENTLSPQSVDELFENVAERQYTRTLLFSSVVDLMGLVVNRIHPAVNAAFHARAETIGVAIKSVYNKLDNLEPVLSAALVGTTAERMETIVTTMVATLPPLLPGYRVRILDGNHLAATEHRIKELRTMRAGALPGQALVVLDPSLMLVTDVILCEDGHAQERSLLDQVLELVRAKDVWIDDRNFCTTSFLFGIARREAFFVVRQHAATLHWEFTGKKRACGRIETGKVFEQTVRLSNPDTGEILFAANYGGPRQAHSRRRRRNSHPDEPPEKGGQGEDGRRFVPQALDHRDRVPGIGGDAGWRDQHAGLPQGSIVRFLRGVGVVQPDERDQGGVVRRPRRADRRREGVGVLPGQRGYDDSQGNDDRDSGGRMGRVPEIDSGRDGRGLDRSGAERAIGFVPQAASRP